MASKEMDAMGPLTLFDYAKIVWRARLLIVALAALAAVVGFATASRMTKVYSAKATVLPPRDSASQGPGFAAMSILGSLTGAQGGGGSSDLMGPLTLFDYAKIVWRARLLIVALAALAAVVGFATASRMTKVYSAKATVLPPRDSASQGPGFAAMSILGSLTGAQGGGGS